MVNKINFLMSAAASVAIAAVALIPEPAHATRYASGAAPPEQLRSNAQTPDPCVLSAYLKVYVSRADATTTVIVDLEGSHGFFDLVRGNLNTLAGDCDRDGVIGDCAGGDYSLALEAITPSSDVCMANDRGFIHQETVVDTRPDPTPGSGEFYVARHVGGCGSSDTYSDGTEVSSPDPGIFSATGTCP